MTWPVSVALVEGGDIIIGAERIKQDGRKVLTQTKRYATQFPYLVGAMDEGGKYHITSKRGARRNGLTMLSGRVYGAYGDSWAGRMYGVSSSRGGL